jgi:hypothetical protein
MGWIAAVLTSLRALSLAAIAGSAQAQTLADPDDQAWNDARQMGTADGYQQYLEQFPVGRHVEDAFRLLVEEQFESEFGPPGSTRGIDMY